jgi:hypothetical protein
MVAGGQRHASAVLHSEKTRYPLYRRLSWPQGRSGQMRKISPPTGILSPDRPARSEWLYRLSSPGPPTVAVQTQIYPAHQVMICGGTDVLLPAIFISVMYGRKFSVSSPGRSTLVSAGEERLRPRACLDA